MFRWMTGGIHSLACYENKLASKDTNKWSVVGTFGRLLKRGVAAGAMFPDYVNTMHKLMNSLVLKISIVQQLFT